MNALSYLILTKMKNRLLTLKRKPALMVLYIVILVIILASMVFLIFAENEEGASYGNADKRIIYLIIAGFGLLYLAIFTNSGLSTGSTLFTMPDVGLLFVAPISSKKILMYGLLNTLGKALLGSIFILYQVTNLKVQFNYGFYEIFMLFLIYAVMVLFGQLLSIAIYIFSNQNEKRKRLVKYILYAGLGAILLAVVYTQRQGDMNIMEAFFRTTDSQWFTMVPVAGWAIMFFKGVTGAGMVYILVSLSLFLLFGILIVFLLTLNDADYFEDVLVSTEFAYNKIKAAKEGRGTYNRNRKVKVRDEKFGILKGTGAVAIANRHMLEMKRSSRFGFVDGYTIFLTVAVGIAGYNINGSAGAYIVISSAIYLQFLLSMMGKLKQELLKHYIYLLPDTSFRKVFWGSFTSLMKPTIDGILAFTVFGIVGGADPLTCVFLALAYAASGMLFVGFTLLIQRVLGEQPNKVIQVFITMGLLFLIMVPAAVITSITGFLLPEPLKFLTMLPFIIYCILFASFIMYISKDILDKMEYNMK